QPESSSELDNSVTVRYLAEGAANVVFSLIPYDQYAPSSNELPFVFCAPGTYTVCPRSDLISKVLRVSKKGEKLLSCDIIKQGFENQIRPHFQNGFDQHLMNHDLISLDILALTELDIMLARQSQHNTGSRSLPQRNGITSRILSPHYGILLPNLSSIPNQSFTIEIKPKWLAQSPTAPKHSYRCRTCAMRAMVRYKQNKTGKEYDICPLHLVSGNVKYIKRFVHGKYLEAAYSWPEPVLAAPDEDELVDTMTDYLATGPGHALLQHLKHLQVSNDPNGVLKLDKTGDSAQRSDIISQLRLAMTLRDCSLFVSARLGPTLSIEKRPRIVLSVDSKLGDLDFKSVEKVDDWDKKEMELIHGGWY
ncbi:uncharacterized protein BDR25DRAFT_183659, partial [Lindgomyces ingoldianus]